MRATSAQSWLGLRRPLDKAMGAWQIPRRAATLGVGPSLARRDAPRPHLCILLLRPELHEA
jgi:hypothetical protein